MEAEDRTDDNLEETKIIAYLLGTNSGYRFSGWGGN
jgi:hypothetical protein